MVDSPTKFATPRNRLATSLIPIAIVLGLGPAGAFASSTWSGVPGEPAGRHAGNAQVIEASAMRTFTLDQDRIERTLEAAPGDTDELSRAHVVSLPAPDGGFQRFEIAETPVMAPKLAELHPEIRTYAGKGVEDPAATVRITTSPLGFQASVRGGELGSWYVDPVYRNDTSLYASYFGADLVNRHGPLTESEEIAADPGLLAGARRSGGRVASNGTQLRTYRLALLSDPTYATYHGGGANVTAAKVALINRVDQIYEGELAIRLVLIANNNLLNLDTAAQMTGADGPCGTSPCFTTDQAAGCTGGTLSRNRIVIGQIIGASNYDIGHIIFGLSGGGVAGLGVVGDSGKARGCTGVTAPIGDFFAVDYVAHEMGHQFAGNHTFDGTESNCSAGNRNPGTSVEPGSGSSIMAYAGICDRDDLQPHSDPYFSQRSFDEIVTYVTGSPGSINEIQSAAFTGFGAGDSFTLTYNGTTSTTTITNGTNYNTAGLTLALGEILPAGTVPVVDGFGGTLAPSANGFEVEFSGTLSGTDVPQMLQVTNVSGFTASVNDIDQGGPVDNQGAATATGNTPPAVTAPAAFTIPYRTPFALTGSATDPDPDTLTYMWEQNDIGVGAGTLLVSPSKTTGPLFRQFGTALDAGAYDGTLSPSPGENAATTDPTRVFPDMAQILANNTNAATGDCPNGPPPGVEPVPAGLVDCYSEFLPTPGYLGPMHFRLTARDGNAAGGGVGNAETTVNLAPDTGPFLVTAPNTAATWASSSTQTVTWNLAGTSGPPISAANVKISLSTDGGQTYPHTLAASTANDGLADVTVPAGLTTSQARVKVEAVGNVFFDVSNANFTITSTAAGPVVSNDAPSGTVTVAQGSDLSPVTVSASDADSVGNALVATPSGLPAGVTLTPGANSGGTTLPGTAAWRVGGGPVTAAVGTYPVIIGVGDPTLTGSTSFQIVVEATPAPGAQTIDFPPISDRTYGDPDFAVSATASSGLPVSFTAAGDCTVAGGTVAITGAGACTVTAHQQGNAAVAPADDVARTLAIARAPTTTTLTVKPKKAKRKRKVTATAVVASSGPKPSGSVSFAIGARNLGTVPVAAEGSAKVKFKAKKSGKVTATYTDAQADFAGSAGTAKLKVKRRRR